jgi:polyphosphate kinase
MKMSGMHNRSEGESPETFINRELGWLAFNRRVLAEAANADNPAAERLKFLSITASNLDEFFMVRVASLRARVLAGEDAPDPAGLTPREQLTRILADAHAFMDEQIATLHTDTLPALMALGLPLLTYEELTPEQARWAAGRFRNAIRPKLTISLRGQKQPQPLIAGRALCLAIEAAYKKAPGLAGFVQCPAGLPRVWRLPKALGDGFILIEEIIRAFAAQLAPGRQVLACWPFRATRDADFTVTGGDGDLIAEMQKSLQKRTTGPVVRLEVDARAGDALTRSLRALTGAPIDAVFPLDGPLNLTFLLKELYGQPELAAAVYPPFESRMPAALAGATDLFAALREGDVFLHHPYDSFDAVLRFVRDAAADPRVLAIKQTLYRVSGASPVVKALCDAAEAGKRVTVLLEVKARFDEENNIHWGKVLERAGCRVLYGLPQLKTHSKITLVVRREGQGLKRYVHLGTGNYNDVTAKQYTDMGLLTADAALGEDAEAFFNMITGFSRRPQMRRLVYAPKMLRPALTALIAEEAAHARAGRPSGIYAKMNALVDPAIIRALYAAREAGVPIRLMVRGVCCLRAGAGIEVRSIVGRFLEHSRVFYFENGGEPQIFLSSADWMPRNLNRRVELMFPVADQAVRARVLEVLNMQWQDTAKAWFMDGTGQYHRLERGENPLNAQEELAKIDE